MRRLVEREEVTAPTKAAIKYLRDIQFELKDVRKYEEGMQDFLASRKAALPEKAADEMSSLATRMGNDLEEWRARIDTIIEMLQGEPLDDEAKPSWTQQKSHARRWMPV